MSLKNVDAAPRMKDILKPDDLNTEACVNLVEAILNDAADEYRRAYKAALRNPASKGAQIALSFARSFYCSDYFAALSCGLTSGPEVMRELELQVRRSLDRERRRPI